MCIDVNALSKLDLSFTTKKCYRQTSISTCLYAFMVIFCDLFLLFTAVIVPKSLQNFAVFFINLPAPSQFKTN